jgi:tRNA1(Val) A37 N6-methylase TrmN6
LLYRLHSYSKIFIFGHFVGFPWAELGPGATVCDVGGGIGAITMQLAKAYPNLQLKLQDTPERVQQAETHVWPKECPEAIKEQRIEFMAMDFLTESPIKGCDVYYVRFSPLRIDLIDFFS